MVYLIVNSKLEERIMLVKAKDRDELFSRLKLKDSQTIAGCLNDSEMRALADGTFTVITA